MDVRRRHKSSIDFYSETYPPPPTVFHSVTHVPTSPSDLILTTILGTKSLEDKFNRMRKTSLPSISKPDQQYQIKLKSFTHKQIKDKILQRGHVQDYVLHLIETAVALDAEGFTFNTKHPSWKLLSDKVKSVSKEELNSSGSDSKSSPISAISPLLLNTSTHPSGISDQNRSRKWMELLGFDDDFDFDQGFVSSFETIQLDLKNQRVVHMDVQRTRQELELFRTMEVRQELEAILTQFCKEERINYKQGLNYVLAPIFMLGYSWQKTLRMLQQFIHRFQPNTFSDDDFGALQCMFRLLRLLLLYHDPKLSNHLDNQGMKPELFAMPWFMTFFGSKITSPILNYLWDYLISCWDDLSLVFKRVHLDTLFKTIDPSDSTRKSTKLHFFVFLALLISERENLLPLDLMLPEKLSHTHFNSTDEVDILVHQACFLMLQTPQSFFSTLDCVLSNARIPDPSPIYDELSAMSCLTISPKEVCALCTAQSHRKLNNADSDKKNTIPQDEFLVLDCRQAGEYESGHLEHSLHLDPSTYHDEMKMYDLLDELKSKQGTHLCILGDGHTSPALNRFDVQLKDMLLRNNFSHVSICEGGFQDLHLYLEGSNSLSTLIGHNSAYCKECCGMYLSETHTKRLPKTRALTAIHRGLTALAAQYAPNDACLVLDHTYISTVELLTSMVCAHTLEVMESTADHLIVITTSSTAHQYFSKATLPYQHCMQVTCIAIKFESVMREEIVKGEKVTTAVRVTQPSLATVFEKHENKFANQHTGIIIFEPLLTWNSVTVVSETLESMFSFLEEMSNDHEVCVSTLVGGRGVMEKIHRCYGSKIPSLQVVCGIVEQVSFDGISQTLRNVL